MFFKEYYSSCLAQASYLVADDDCGTAAVVDPTDATDAYVAEAIRHGVRIRHVLLTHVHPGFLAAQLELGRRTGAQLYVGARAGTDGPHLPVKEGDVLEFGSVRIRILDAPGHTPDSILILLYDLKRDSRAPVSVLTGDTLLVNDVAGPDMTVSGGKPSAAELAGMLYDSLHGKVLSLPETTLVYPAHASARGGRGHGASNLVSTLAAQRKDNHALQPMTKSEFVRRIISDLPAARGVCAATAPARARLQPAGLKELLRLRELGVPTLDVRSPVAFAGAHLAGSINISMTESFGCWAASILGKRSAVAVVGEPDCEQDAADLLGQACGAQTVHYLESGMKALSSRHDLVRQLDRVCATALAERLLLPAPPLLLDVRSRAEWGEGAMEGSLNIALEELKDRIEEIPEGREIVVYSTNGFRSSVAASLLQSRLRSHVASLIGGFRAWKNVSRLSAALRSSRGAGSGGPPLENDASS